MGKYSELQRKNSSMVKKAPYKNKDNLDMGKKIFDEIMVSIKNNPELQILWDNIPDDNMDVWRKIEYLLNNHGMIYGPLSQSIVANRTSRNARKNTQGTGVNNTVIDNRQTYSMPFQTQNVKRNSIITSQTSMPPSFQQYQQTIQALPIQQVQLPFNNTILYNQQPPMQTQLYQMLPQMQTRIHQGFSQNYNQVVPIKQNNIYNTMERPNGPPIIPVNYNNIQGNSVAPMAYQYNLASASAPPLQAHVNNGSVPPLQAHANNGSAQPQNYLSSESASPRQMIQVGGLSYRKKNPKRTQKEPKKNPKEPKRTQKNPKEPKKNPKEPKRTQKRTQKS
jgi:hypothetical protein